MYHQLKDALCQYVTRLSSALVITESYSEAIIAGFQDGSGVYVGLLCLMRDQIFLFGLCLCHDVFVCRN
jgi:hypothetical protein